MQPPDDAKNPDPLTGAIIGAAIRVNKAMGIGLLEIPYEVFLCHELAKLGLSFSRQPQMPVSYDGVRVELGYRPDVIVQDEVIIEIKAVEKVLPVHRAQLLTYLRLSGIKTGLLINFHAMPFVSGIIRLVY